LGAMSKKKRRRRDGRRRRLAHFSNMRTNDQSAHRPKPFIQCSFCGALDTLTT
jgi:hypothetical protein